MAESASRSLRPGEHPAERTGGSIAGHPRVPVRRRVFAALYGGVVLGGVLSGYLLEEIQAFRLYPDAEGHLWWIVVATILIYILVAALPFVPAAEIGLGLMLMSGVEVAVLMYSSTVLALVLAYLIGRAVPAGACATAFDFFGLRMARDQVLAMEDLDADARIELLLAGAPARVAPMLLRHRYLTLAVALNLPGNSVLGGGGGIAISAGMSGLYPVPAYLATVAIAVAPVPLCIALAKLLQ